MSNTTAEIIQVNPPTRSVTAFPADATRGKIIAWITKNSAMDSNGIPYAMYRSDLIPDWSQGLAADNIAPAAMNVNHNEHFAAFADGQPIWHKMPHEPLQLYQLFTQYLDQLKTVGIRQVFKLSTGVFDFATLQDIAKEYYWVIRAKAFDIYEEVAYQKQRQYLIKKTENEHFLQAKSLLDDVLLRLQEDDAFAELSAKEAIDAMEKLIKIQRTSLGLSAQQGSPTAMNMAPGTSVEAIVRTVTQVQSSGEGQGTNTLERLDSLLKMDPKFALSAQEVIVRMRSDDVDPSHRPPAEY